MFTTSSYRLPSSLFAFLALVFSLQYLVGTCMVNGFRNIGDDEGSIKYTRGYRCGVKFLSAASLLDMVQMGLLAIYFLSQLRYYDDMWQVEAIQPNPITIYCLFIRLLHVASLVLYAAAFFYMEAYHSIGTAELWGWGIASMFGTTAFLELLSLVTDSRVTDLMFTILNAFVLMSSAVWAQTFEALIVSKEVDMDQSALRNEWFKSRNAMAYYGPPIEEGIEMVRE
ncbi:putative transmembrane protein [Gregarina niphandrodes]|uniref:Transmembrane protein n=1 Tax=Gregarina niphandrodes TaxID=110365 RepID=A0A023BDQ6_GRENI|nr:putative transmembrane protein [Gregarina niphandrodes]EZG88838.1 putative transmembrane protein [Gregarina niphandrodes]|eukprot:XP_011128537.1 putative transmembrane protein [Gregarina niphandrodes]